MIFSKRGSSQLEGRGDESVSIPGRNDFTPEAGHRHIYYRLYTKDGPLNSNNPIYSDDRHISRTSSKSVAPPRTAALLKSHLGKFEGNGARGGSTRMALRGSTGPGSSELDPVILVVASSAVARRSVAASEVGAETLNEWPHEKGYVYYRVYDEGGETVSKTSFKSEDTALGRIDTVSIPPPYTGATLKGCLIQAEGISGHSCQLFRDDEGETILNDNVTISFLGDNYPGKSADEPIAFVYNTQENAAPAAKTETPPVTEKEAKVTAKTPKFGRRLSARVADLFKGNQVKTYTAATPVKPAPVLFG